MSNARYPAGSPSADPEDESGRDRVEQELAEREAAIHRRIESLEHEVTTAPAAIKSSLTRHPLIGLAGAVAAGLAVGFLVTRKRKPDVAPFHQRLVEQYIEAVGDDVRHRIRRGGSPSDAVREALADRAPLVVYAPVRERERGSEGFWSVLGDIALKTALGFAVKVALDAAASNIDVEELSQSVPPENEGADLNERHAGDGAAGIDQPADVE